MNPRSTDCEADPLITTLSRRMFDYESEDQSSELPQELQFKVIFFLHLVDHAIASLKDRFEQTHFVTKIFYFLLRQENLLQAFNENNILDACKTFHDKLGDTDPFEMKELERFVHGINENKESLKTTRHFLISAKNIYWKFTQICSLL